MSHRNYEHPRCGSLGFLPRKRCRHHRGRIRSFPVDDVTQKPHLTAFIGYKAGMTHIVRELDKVGSKNHKKEIVEAVSVIETPPMIVVGLVGYVKTPRGLRCLSTVWANHLSETFRRSLYKHWAHSKQKAFTKYLAKWEKPEDKKRIENTISRIEKYAHVVRVIAHTQQNKLHLHQKKAHALEIQINGGDTKAKVAFGQALFEKSIEVGTIFHQNELIDAVSVSKGHGFEGVTHRWGTTRLPRKTHKGLRKVACVGAWHPARIQYTVPRAGQNGYHHRTEVNKKVYRVGKALADEKEGDHKQAFCEADNTDKDITPMGGFPHYGIVKNEFVVVKGSVPGPVKRPLTLRKSLKPQISRVALEQITLKFIDTSSKFGHGKFQTLAEKTKFMGPTKRRALANAPAEEKA